LTYRRLWLALLPPVVLAGALAGYFYDSKPDEPGQGAPPVTPATAGMVWIPAGEFLMGSVDTLAHPNEGPVHRVRVSGFWIDIHHVTNAEFAEFVAATGYVTTAERRPDWEELKKQVPEGTPKPDESVLVPGSMVFVPTSQPVRLDDWSQWWQWVPGASWRHPSGPGSSIEGQDDFPVVQVSFQDAQAYARWRGKRLPTEAEWEYAARGGLDSKRYSWGNELRPNGKKMGNVWDGPFPVNAGEHGLTRVGSFPANGFGLYDMTGNAWHWTADRYRADAFRLSAQSEISVDPPGPLDSFDPEDRSNPHTERRVIRGGSYLCSPDYCLSYRPSARRGETPDSSASHIGFRLVIGPVSVR
jgi:formylglycine-generating enzyme required for sulfatase activity